jgi:hypothetical protein
MSRVSVVVAALAAVVMVCGCESSSSSVSGGSGGDAIDINSIAWLGDNYSGATRTATLNSASLSGDTLSVSYEPYSWPRQTVKVSVDAICCLFYERGGQIVGGKYDYWRTGGQGSKNLENVRHHYQGHSWPTSGARIYTMNVSLNGGERSNIIEVTR